MYKNKWKLVIIIDYNRDTISMDQIEVSQGEEQMKQGWL